MNNIQIEQFNKRLEELGKFTQGRDGNYKESEIIDWIADCVNLFYEIGVDSVVIRHFLDYFNFRDTEVEIDDGALIRMSGDKDRLEKVRFIGPFQEKVEGDYFRRRTGDYILTGSFYYAKVAFSAARNKLRSKIEKKQIVPKFLIDSLSQEVKYLHIVSSLELIEQAYKDKNPDGLVKNSITLLDSILDLESALKSKGKISKKLDILMSDPTVREKFGIEREFVFALDNSRLIRNLRSVHKARPLKYDIPFIVAVSCAYLVIVFLENTLSHGELIMQHDHTS